MRRFQMLRRLVERHPFASDIVVALAVAGFVQADIWTSGDYLTASKAIYVPSGLLMTLPLAWRRRAPLAVTVVVMGALVFESLAVGSAPTPDSPLIGWLLAIYSVAAHRDRVAALVGGAAGLAAGAVWIGFDDVFFPVVVFGGAWLAGRLVRQRHVHALALEERADALEREREANARAASAEERARIARELHDVLSHSVSVMVVQAGAERMALGSGRAATRSPSPLIGSCRRRSPMCSSNAGPASARVVVRYGERELELEVADDGRGPREGGDPGHGLVGMRERVALYGGHFDAAARNGGGFVVHARLPFAATP